MDLVRKWVSPCGKFSLKVYDEGKWSGGRRRLTYKFYARMNDNANRVLIFKDDSFGPSPQHDDDSDETLGALLGWCSLRPGDTDPDYFEHYNQLQWDFANLYGEELSMYAMQLEGTW